MAITREQRERVIVQAASSLRCDLNGLLYFLYVVRP